MDTSGDWRVVVSALCCCYILIECWKFKKSAVRKKFTWTAEMSGDRKSSSLCCCCSDWMLKISSSPMPWRENWQFAIWTWPGHDSTNKTFEQLLCSQTIERHDSDLSIDMATYRKRHSCETTILRLVEDCPEGHSWLQRDGRDLIHWYDEQNLRLPSPRPYVKQTQGLRIHRRRSEPSSLILWGPPVQDQTRVHHV